MTYRLDEYALMVRDDVRRNAYVAALRETVRPGCVVADIGSGPGVFGVFAALLGARRVFLVEPDRSVRAALALAAENGVADRVEIIQAFSTDVTLPERADVIVSDLRGILPLLEDHLHAAADMRQRHLAEGGVCIPLRDRLFVGLLEDEMVHARTVGAWSGVSSLMQHRSLDSLQANRPFRTFATADQLLTDATPWVVLDYAGTTPRIDATMRQTVVRTGTAHGISCWFDAELTPSVHFSNSPHATRALYGQAFFPFASPFAVHQGECVVTRLCAVHTAKRYEWIWEASVESSSPPRGAPRHATLHGQLLTPTDLIARK